MFIPLHDANSLKHIRLQYVTLTLIALNVLIWLVTGTPAITDQATLQAAFYSFGFVPSVANGYEVLPVELEILPTTATYISYAFLHGDFMHLAGNMLFVWVFGDNVEDAMGHLRFLGFYILCAIAGALAHSYMVPQSNAPLIGASGAVAGIIGAYLVLHPKVRVWILALGRIPLRIPAVIVLGFWIAFQLFQVITSPNDQISWSAHIGGMLAGVVLIVFMKRREVALFDRDINIVIPDPANDAPKVPVTAKPEKSGDTPRTSVPGIAKSRGETTGEEKPRSESPFKWGR